MTNGNAISESSLDLRLQDDLSDDAISVHDDEVTIDEADTSVSDAERSYASRTPDSDGTVLFHRPIRWIRQRGRS